MRAPTQGAHVRSTQASRSWPPAWPSARRPKQSRPTATAAAASTARTASMAITGPYDPVDAAVPSVAPLYGAGTIICGGGNAGGGGTKVDIAERACVLLALGRAERQRVEDREW